MKKVLLFMAACLLCAGTVRAQDADTDTAQVADTDTAQAADADTAQAAEEEKFWSVDTSVSVFSDYMWRGFRLYDGPSIQPSLTVSADTGYGVLSGNGWMHISGDSDKQAERFTEFDGTLKYEYQIGPVVLGAGHIWYTYSDFGDGTEIPDSAEFFGSVAVDVLLAPTLTVYHDYEEFHNQFYELGFSHEFAEIFGEGTSVTPYASFGWASHAEKAYDKGGLEEVTIGTSLAMPFGPLSFEPSVNYTFGIDKLTQNQFWAGLTLAYSF